MKYSVELLKRQLRRFIVEGYFPPGQPLPTLEKLSQTFGVSRVTAQEAVHALRKAGLVETKRGQGIFVQQPLTWNARGRRVALVSALDPGYLRRAPYPGPSIRALRRSLKASGYQLASFSLKTMGLAEVSTFLRKRALAGVILHEIDSVRLIDEVRELNLPLVSMDFDAYRSAVPSVLFDNLHAGFQAARHLLAHGHRRIVYVRRIFTGLRLRSRLGRHAPVDPVEDDRMRGYHLALKEAGRPPCFHEKRDPLEAAGLQALFARKAAPTALLCSGDELAVELAEALRGLGYAVPDDVSLIGFGAMQKEFAEGRKISSVRLDFEGLGRETARLFLETLEGQPPRRVVLPVRLEDRDSVASVPPVRDAMPAFSSA